MSAPSAAPAVRIRVSQMWAPGFPFVALAEVVKDGQRKTYQGSGDSANEALRGLAQLLAEATYMPVTHSVEHIA